MTITIDYVDNESQLILKFMPYAGRDLRLWIRDPEQWYQTIGRYCPHKNISGDECIDCALNVE